MNGVQLYFNLIADRFNSDLMRVYMAVKAAYGMSHEQSEEESNEDYMERCIEQDYQDGFNDAAMFQDLFDRTQLFLSAKKMYLDCAVCGIGAGRWSQHSNRDIGYGICVSCLVQECGVNSREKIYSLYGYPRLNYDVPLVKCCGLYYRALALFDDTAAGLSACQSYLSSNPGTMILENSKPSYVIVSKTDPGCVSKFFFSDRFLNYEDQPN